MPTLSIIIPVYNVEQYLEACINSVLANNFKDYEIIVIDDGSKDGTGDLCDSLPRAWRYTSKALRNISEEVVCFSQAKSAMFYQTVLRKLQNPDNAYINESIEYVKTHKKQLRLFKWGIKYYISALLLCANYKLWAKIFRYGMD